MKITILAAWPDKIAQCVLALPEGSTVADALAACPIAEDFPHAGQAIFGRRVSLSCVLREGDRLELLRALQVDPKKARRERAEAARALEKKPRN